MRTAEAYWRGKHEVFTDMLNRAVPPAIDGPLTMCIAAARRWKPGLREPAHYAMAVVRELVKPWLILMGAWKMSEQVAVVSEEATDRALASMERLDHAVDKFRSNVANDLKSMKAVSDRVEGEVQRMAAAYQHAAGVLNSAAFVTAIENAERMAKALEAIQKLGATRLSMALFVGDDVQMGDAP